MENKRQAPRFGPGGNSESFHLTNLKTTDAPFWIKSRGLDAYEYEAGRGFSASPSILRQLGINAKEAGVHLSVHAPYFISLSSIVTETRLKSIAYIEESIAAAECLGADIVVVHTGSASKITRTEALNLAADTLYKALEIIPDNGVKIGLETMGKINQLGTLEEVLTLCKMDKRLQPVVDFGHMNARESGARFRSKEDYLFVFDQIANALGDCSAQNLHSHFSKIEWSAGGEKRHLTFEDTVFGPPYEPFIEALAEEKLTPTVICESAGTQAEDALSMKTYYMSKEKI